MTYTIYDVGNVKKLDPPGKQVGGVVGGTFKTYRRNGSFICTDCIAWTNFGMPPAQETRSNRIKTPFYYHYVHRKSHLEGPGFETKLLVFSWSILRYNTHSAKFVILTPFHSLHTLFYCTILLFLFPILSLYHIDETQKFPLYTGWFKYDRDWFVCKEAALRSSCATLREWSHNLHPPSRSG